MARGLRSLSDEDVIEMRERWRRGETMPAIAHRFGLTQNNTEAAVYGRTYADVACPVGPGERALRPRYPRKPHANTAGAQYLDRVHSGNNQSLGSIG